MKKKLNILKIKNNINNIKKIKKKNIKLKKKNKTAALYLSGNFFQKQIKFSQRFNFPIDRKRVYDFFFVWSRSLKML